MVLELWSQRTRETRDALGLSQPDMAALLNVSSDDVKAWESGETPTPHYLGRYARLLGLEADEFLRQPVSASNPTRLLFRYAQSTFDQTSTFEAHHFLPPEAALSLGDFLCNARRLQRLEGLLGWPSQQERLETIQPAPLAHALDDGTYKRAAKQGQELAHEARRAWGLGDEPISSMLAFVEEALGVPVLVGNAKDLPKNIEAAAVRLPMAFVLVRNPTAYDSWAARFRVTLAHELCHLLHDRDELDADHTGAPFFSFTPTTQRAKSAKPTPSLWHRRFQRLECIEARARSFAACFLAPLSGVKALLGDERPDTSWAIYRVGEHFGVGREVAINQLCNAFFEPYSPTWKDAGRRMRQLLGSPTKQPQEVLRPDPIHPRLRRAILAAAQEKKITLSEAWGYAGRRLDEPLALPQDTQDPRLTRPLRASNTVSDKHSL